MASPTPSCSPVLGNLTQQFSSMVGPDSTPSFDGGWFGYVSKDLRTQLGLPVQGPFSRRYCGNGSLTACRDVAVGRDRGHGHAARGRAGREPEPVARDDAQRISFAPG